MQQEKQKAVIANYKSVMYPMLTKVNFMTMLELNAKHNVTKNAIHEYNPTAPKKLRALVDQWYDGLYLQYVNNNVIFVYRLESGTYTTHTFAKNTSLLHYGQSPEYIKNGLLDFAKYGLFVYKEDTNKVWYSGHDHKNLSGDPVNASNSHISANQKIAIKTAYNLLSDSNSPYADQSCLYLKQLINKLNK